MYVICIILVDVLSICKFRGMNIHMHFVQIFVKDGTRDVVGLFTCGSVDRSDVIS